MRVDGGRRQENVDDGLSRQQCAADGKANSKLATGCSVLVPSSQKSRCRCSSRVNEKSYNHKCMSESEYRGARKHMEHTHLELFLAIRPSHLCCCIKARLKYNPSYSLKGDVDVRDCFCAGLLHIAYLDTAFHGLRWPICEAISWRFDDQFELHDALEGDYTQEHFPASTSVPWLYLFRCLRYMGTVYKWHKKYMICVFDLATSENCHKDVKRIDEMPCWAHIWLLTG